MLETVCALNCFINSMAYVFNKVVRLPVVFSLLAHLRFQ